MFIHSEDIINQLARLERGKHRRVLAPPHYWWKNSKLGPGPVPIETTEGWLMIYHGICT